MSNDYIHIAEAYITQVPQVPVQPTPAHLNQNNQEEVKKPAQGIKDWIRLPFIDTPFKARMAAVLIVELINNMTRDADLKDLVLKEIRTSNRLHRRK